MSATRLANGPKLLLATFAVCLVALFLIANRPAYKAFFSDDDFDNMANAREADLPGFAHAIISPTTQEQGQFRAAAYWYYYVLVRWAKLRFPPYVAGIHAIHLLNVLLIWWLARSMGAEIVGACAAALLYAFHAAAFDIYWKPMYVFDLLCGTFTLAALLSYVRGHLALSLLFFWLSLKAKEVTILLPVVLAGYEWARARGMKTGRGEPRVPVWVRLAPFFAISAWVGVVALMKNAGRDDAYSLRFTAAALWQCIRYYSSQVLLIPYAGLALAALAFVKNPRVRLGFLTFVVLLGPMLVLPGRLFAAYLYVPLIGLAVALSAVTRAAWLAAFFAAWLPWNYLHFRVDRREAQTVAAQRKAWLAPVEALVRQHPEIDTFVYDGTPDYMPHHAVAGALRVLREGQETHVLPLSRGGWEALSAPHLAVFVWDPARLKLYLMPRVPDVAYVYLDEHAPVWQLTLGWRENQGTLRWMRPRASVRLLRPAHADRFEVWVNAVLRGAKQRQLAVTINGVKLGTIRLTEEAIAKFHLPVPPGPEGPVQVDLTASPPIPDPTGDGELGQPVLGLGFPPAGGSRDLAAN
jgi:hypothetical protein